MSFSVRTKNFGKLHDAEFRIEKFTVFAGPNNSGKSFVSKMLYSIFNGMRGNHAETYLLELFKDADVNSRFFSVHYFDELLDDELEKITKIIQGHPLINLKEIESASKELDCQIKKILKKLRLFQSSKKKSRPKSKLSISISRMIEIYTEIETKLQELDANAIISRGMESELRKNVINNFQVEQLSQLASKENLPIEIDIESLGKFKFLNERIRWDESDAWIDPLRYSNLIYLESPVYWKLKSALEVSRHELSRFSYLRRRQALGGVPQYFYDLVNAIKIDYAEDIAFPELHEKLTEEFIGGKMEVSKDGDISYRENGRSFSLAITANGVANLGFLALLIERKVLDQNAFIFIDEPEAHLHPAWQVIMAEALFELSKKGVHVAIATNSVDIMKWLDVHVQKNQDDKNLIALNQFSSGASDNDNFEDKITAIKQELIKPFSDLYLDGL